MINKHLRRMQCKYITMEFFEDICTMLKLSLKVNKRIS